ncbi:heavy-metal-associated domain-containing protein [Helicobacter burdigaliensis]|uniref:heavy-metal-associated domain-containing protein n=1 Tax=Helicobacter burdigaliensis TaxID=2315334 RepID=UPI000EF70E55|nr:heavy metal-associated domain-containing protein [Helicobacter burdigaliensis]
MKIQCQNIKCQGCVNKIEEALKEKFPSLKVDIPTQSVEVEANADEEQFIKTTLSNLGFLASGGVFAKVKGFFQK